MESVLDRVRSARAAVTEAMPPRANINATRYVWHPIMNISHADVLAINDGFPMQRLKWQPIVQAPRWEHIQAVPEGPRVATRPKPPERPREAMYWIAPAKIADSLQSLYAESGLLDSKTLVGVELDMFARLYLDDIFFPEDAEKLPATFRAAEERIVTQLQRLKEGSPAMPDGTPVPLAQELIPHVIEIGNEMLERLRYSAGYLRRYIDERHAEMKKAETDTSGRYRGTYDRREYLMLAWLEIAPRDQALNKLAADHNSMPEVVAQAVQASMTATAELVKASQVNAAELGSAIGKSLAEALGPMIAGAATKNGKASTAPTPKANES